MHMCSDLCHADKLIDFKPDMTSRAAALYAHADGILKWLCSACYNYCYTVATSAVRQFQ